MNDKTEDDESTQIRRELTGLRADLAAFKADLAEFEQQINDAPRLESRVNATPVEQPPLPTAHDLARPFLQGLYALHELANFERCVEMDTAEKEGTVERAIELGLVLRQAIDIVVGFTTSCTAGPLVTENGRAMRRVLESISESASLDWTFYNLSQTIIDEFVA